MVAPLAIEITCTAAVATLSVNVWPVPVILCVVLFCTSLPDTLTFVAFNVPVLDCIVTAAHE